MIAIGVERIHVETGWTADLRTHLFGEHAEAQALSFTQFVFGACPRGAQTKLRRDGFGGPWQLAPSRFEGERGKGERRRRQFSH